MRSHLVERFWGPSELTIREWIGSINTSAFLGTNPTDDPITSGFPVIREQSRTIWRVLANHFGKTDLSVKQKHSGRASPFWTGAAESRKTVTSMLTRKDDQ